MLRRSLSLIVLLAFLSLLWISCTSDGIVQPKKDVLQSTVSAGELHNEILSTYAERHNLFLDKITREEATKLFIESANEVLKKYGIDFTVDVKFVDVKLAEFEKLKEKCVYDFFKHGSDQEVVFS